MALKILVSGDVEGKFDELFKRVNAVNKKNGPFEMLICVGNFFGSSTKDQWQEYLDNPSKVPIPTYILGPNKSEHVEYYPNDEGSELCDNVTYLGKTGLLSGSSGLQIAYVSGTESRDDLSGRICFTTQEIDEFRAAIINKPKFKGVDILLTSIWPRNVTKYAPCPDEGDPSESGSSLLSQLALELKPRYQFCAWEDVHYERLPYRNHRVLQEGAKQITRFIALARVGNLAKKKWLYAFSITPMDKMEHSELIKQPDNVTECPYQFEEITSKQKPKEAQQQFFYDLSSKNDDRSQRGGKRGQGRPQQQDNKRPKTRLPLSSSCWFCLSGSQVEKHLVVSVGDHNYLSLPKGGLVSDHLLILPIGHCQATTGLDEEALDEINSFKVALRSCYKSQGKTVVFFERNYKSHHLQIQVVPVPESKSNIIKQTFLDIAESQSITLDEIPVHSDLKQGWLSTIVTSIDGENVFIDARHNIQQPTKNELVADIVNPGAPYFYVELPNGDKLLHRIRKFFPLQFGREVLASPPLLNLPDKVDWRDCSSSREEEINLANAFRKVFLPFDFTQ